MPSLPSLDFLPCLKVPKYVEIINPRVNVLYYFIVVVVMVLIVVNFFLSEVYAQAYPVSTRLRVSFSDLKHVHQYSTSGTDSDAVRICPNGTFSASGSCISVEETFVRKSSDHVFLATSWSPSFNDPVRLIPAVDTARLVFDYTYETKISETFGVPDKVRAGTNELITTRVMDGKNEPAYVFGAGESINMSVTQLVKLIGSGTGVEHKSFQMNQALRRSGLEIEVKVHCHRKVFRDIMCDMRLQWTSPDASITQLLALQSGLTQRAYNGLFVRCEQGQGTIYALSINQLITYLSTAIVYAAIPSQLCFCFLIICVGHLSKIYWRAIIEPFSIVKDTAHTALRLMSWSVPFVDLAQMSGTDGITPEVLHARCSKVLEDRREQIQDEELESMVRFVFQEVNLEKIEHDQQRTHFQACASAIANSGGRFFNLRRFFQKHHGNRESAEIHSHESTRENMEAAARVPYINIDSYSEACGSGDKVAFEDIAKLFDVDRKRTILERLFTPESLTQAMEIAHRVSRRVGRVDSNGIGELANLETLESRKLKQWEIVKDFTKLQEQVKGLTNSSEQLDLLLNAKFSPLDSTDSTGGSPESQSKAESPSKAEFASQMLGKTGRKQRRSRRSLSKSTEEDEPVQIGNEDVHVVISMDTGEKSWQWQTPSAKASSSGEMLSGAIPDANQERSWQMQKPPAKASSSGEMMTRVIPDACGENLSLLQPAVKSSTLPQVNSSEEGGVADTSRDASRFLQPAMEPKALPETAGAEGRAIADAKAERLNFLRAKAAITLREAMVVENVASAGSGKEVLEARDLGRPATLGRHPATFLEEDIDWTDNEGA